MRSSIVYDLNIIKDNLNYLINIFGKENVYYATMANSNMDIINFISSFEVGFFVTSSKHLVLLEKIKRKVLFSASGFLNETEKHYVFEQCFVNISSERQYHFLKKNFPYKKFGIRVNPRCFGIEDHNRVAHLRLGLSIERIKEIAVKDPYFNGLHFYPGDKFDSASYLITLAKLKSVARECNTKNINLSGGMPLPGTEKQFFKKIQAEVDSGDFFFSIEPGRSIVKNAAYFETEIVDIVNQQKTQYLIVNSTFESCPRYMMQRDSGIEVTLQSNAKTEMVMTHICGSSCYSKDIIYAGLFPKAKIGEKVRVKNVGSYFEQCATDYLGFGLPDIIFKGADNECN